MKKHPNRLEGQEIKRAEQAFVSDITYVETDEGVLLILIIPIQAFLHKVGHRLSHKPNRSFLPKTIHLLLWRIIQFGWPNVLRIYGCQLRQDI